NRLIDARLKVVKLNTEARVRDGLASKGQFKPPMDVRVSNAREELRTAQKLLIEPPHLKEGTWKRFQTDLQAFIDVTEDQRNFSLHGFDQYFKLDNDFNEVTTQAIDDYHDVDQRIEAVQQQGKQTIIKWSIIAVLVGALVAAGTVWQVQRHFSDMRRSVLETRRERTFTTQLLEGMVSAVAAIDNEDRIRSANAAFFQIFPKASIGASVLEKLGADDAMKMLETVTSIR